MRPRIPGFATGEAAYFREQFRACRDRLDATNASVGNALETYLGDLPGGRDGANGEQAVRSALTRTRAKLTHRSARRLVVALFLSKPARLSERIKNRRAASDRLKLEKGTFNQLAGFMYHRGVWRDPPHEVPVFISLDVVDRFAERVVADVVRRGFGLGEERRSKLLDNIRQCLHDVAPSMGRSWCDMASVIARRESNAENVIEHLARKGFGDHYIPPGRYAAAFGPEFEVLHRKRPELTAGIVMPTPAHRT